MDNITRIAGNNPGRGSILSLDQFRKIAQGHIERIAESRQSLQETFLPFKGKGDIRPIHCKIALESLDEMSGQIGELGELFYKTAQLPLVITSLRYPFLFVLHRIEEQLSKLEELLDSYLVMCMTSTQRAQQQRKLIYDSFETFLLHVTDISQQMKFLNDQAQFHQGSLTRS